MKLSQQVVSLDLSKRLKELGVKQESYFWWVETFNRSKIITSNQGEDYYRSVWDERISAFTVAELGEMLPSGISSVRGASGKWIVYKSAGFDLGITEVPDVKADTEADTRAKMLIYLLENNLIPHA